MAFEPSFTAELLSDSSSIKITDTSTGTDANITTRRVYLQTATGSYLKPAGTTTDYIEWPLSLGESITLDVLDVDYALNVLVEWRDANSVLYSTSDVINFPAHALYAGWQMLSRLSVHPSLINKADFWANLCKLFALIQASNNAVAAGGDITAAQVALNISNNLINNQLIYYS